ncbi:hypothetical protein [Mycobacterium tuberculosis]|uniref:hypothetical protein n=1 Tax=Mycobacterium tuberculosis TaxID=1773 RepID=UPI000E246A62|nr:hypothetical protein [Mycobacterium tuberculosis]REN39240.1 hypothetical protein DSI72_16665 [Mycobacterium tuberculosis]
MSRRASATCALSATTAVAIMAAPAARADDKRLNDGVVNRPGMSGDSSSWKGWGHVRWFIEEVPAGAA